jgi:hypothetical protein
MNGASWMVGVSLAAWAVVALLAGQPLAGEALAGLAGPLAIAGGTLSMAERIYRRRPESLTGFMITAFAAKLVFFGAYVAVMLTLVELRPVPFVWAFTGSFIALHMTEAFHVRRLFSGETRASR